MISGKGDSRSVTSPAAFPVVTAKICTAYEMYHPLSLATTVSN